MPIVPLHFGCLSVNLIYYVCIVNGVYRHDVDVKIYFQLYNQYRCTLQESPDPFIFQEGAA